MSRIRLNQEYRNKVANRMRVHIEQEDTQEKEKFFQCRENFKEHQDATWQLAQECVSRQYPKADVDMAHYLQDKYENVNTIAKDSCFHFGYMGKPEEKDEEDKYISKHFDFKLNGDMDNIDRQDNENYQPQSRDFAYAYFRDELKGREGCNPDINIEQKDNQSNPHWTKVNDANEKYLGMSGGRDNQTSFAKEWNNDYVLDLIGREYCRDRSIKCEKQEYDMLMVWQQAKGQLIMAHEKWIESILNQMKEIKTGLKMYRFLDEAIKLCNNLDLNVQDHEIIKVNSTGLTIYNPDNLADRIKGMKNKNISREDKILARVEYEKQLYKNN